MFVLEIKSVQLHVAWHKHDCMDDFIERLFTKGSGTYDFYRMPDLKRYDTIVAKKYKVRLVLSVTIRN